MIHPILLPELRMMLAEGDEEGLREFATALHPATVAECAEDLDIEETWRLLSHAPLTEQAEIFSYFPLHKQIEMVDGAGRERMSKLIEEMAPDNRVDLLERLDEKVVENLLPLVAQAERHDIRTLLSYPEDSAGAVMTTEYASLPAEITAEEAIRRLRHQAPHRETIYYVYVLDADRHLLGFVSLQELILSRADMQVGELMHRDVISVRVDEDQEAVAHKLARYDFIAIPVVDTHNRLVGIVTHDDVIDVVMDEATEDVHRLGAVEPLIDTYLHSRFVTLWRKRAGWLAVLFLGQLLTVWALEGYTHELRDLTALVLFIPLIISSGGNSGNQSAALVTRALALGEVRPRDWTRILGREILMGTSLGLALGAIGFGRALWIPESQLAGIDIQWLSLVVALSVTVVVLWGALVGAALPLVFQRLGLDPAIMSNPFVATVVDVTGLVAYLAIARTLLPQ